jgi:hypothetical protein
VPDLIISGNSKEWLEDEVKPALVEFLAERGLVLSMQKTKVAHIRDGFDFLGWNFRKYNGKLLTKPSKANVKAHLDKVREVIKVNKTSGAGRGQPRPATLPSVVTTGSPRVKLLAADDKHGHGQFGRQG